MALRWRIAQFFELFWWRRYLSGQDKTAYLAWKRAYWRQFLDRFDLWPPPDTGVLDAGCGPAGVFIILREMQVDALDPLLTAYERRLPHFSRADYPKVTFFETGLEHFFPEKKYDTVFCFNALNHVDNLRQSILQLSRLLQPRGKLVLTIDGHRKKWLRNLFRLFPGDILHPHQHTAMDYRRLLEKQGFFIEKEETVKCGLIFDYVLFVAILPQNDAA